MWFPLLLIFFALCWFNGEAAYRFDCAVLKIESACAHVQDQYKAKDGK